LAIDAVRRDRSLEAARWIFDEYAARLQLFVLEHGLAVADLRDRNPQHLGQLDDLVGGVLARVGVHDPFPLVEACDALGGLIEFAGLAELGTLDQQEKVGQLLRRVGVEADEAVARGFDRRRLEVLERAQGWRAPQDAPHQVEVGIRRQRRHFLQ
jgi:hypothetical protein